MIRRFRPLLAAFLVAAVPVAAAPASAAQRSDVARATAKKKTKKSTSRKLTVCRKGCRYATLQQAVPFDGMSSWPIFVAGIDSTSRLGQFHFNTVSAAYFRTMGTRIVRERFWYPRWTACRIHHVA